jgi:lipopolysaccharide export LptBFGC system permease protein LptF
VYRLLLSLFSLCLVVTAVSGQTAADYFHQGAQLYIASKKNESKKVIETGLGFYPQDPLLNGMAGLLKKEEEKQQQQPQQDQKDQQQQDQQKEDQQKQQQEGQQKQDQQHQNQQQQQQDQQKPDQQQQQESQQGQQDQQPQPQQGQEKEQQGQQPASQDQQGSQNEATPPGQMTPQEARQLLDAQKQDEKALPVSPANNKNGQPPNRPIRDW